MSRKERLGCFLCFFCRKKRNVAPRLLMKILSKCRRPYFFHSVRNFPRHFLNPLTKSELQSLAVHLESIFISNLGATLCFFRQKKQRKQPSRSFRDILFPEVFRRKSLLSSKGRLEPVNFEKQN